jgi:tetratricopeptide (TPR) repeat protein
MGLFKKLFASDPESMRKKADALFDAGDYGPAKLAYEKAAEVADASDHPALEDRVRECMDGIARQRIAEARAYLKQGLIELAGQELAGAIEVAADPAVAEEAQRLADGLEAEDAQAQAATEELTDEERLALVMGQWEEAQAKEYDAYGDALLEALLALHHERYDDARTALEGLLENATEPRFLWLEVGRARLLTEDLDGGQAALESFLGALGPGEANEAQVSTNLMLARLADEDGRFEEAMQRFEAAIEALPDDYRPYLAMGAFLRQKGHGDEALAVLQTALELSKSNATDWRLLEELGLAHEMAGKPKEALKFLEQVIEFFTTRQVVDFPPETAMTLAKLYEADGRADRAADLYRALSRGGDRDRHALYHFEAGRLLQGLGLDEEARRMLTRAEALLGDGDGELRAKVTALLQG